MLLTSVSTSWRPSEVAAWALISAQVARPPSGELRSLPVADRPAGGVVHVLAQEHLVRGVRRVGLALVDERRVGVRCDVADTPSGPGSIVPRVRTMKRSSRRQVVAVAEDVVLAAGDQRVVGLERDEDRAVAAVGDLVEAVVEELAEDREQRVERRGEADVGGHVRDEQRLVRSARRSAGCRRAGVRVTGTTPALPWVRTGKPAAATAAGLVEVWSTIRLLTVRGWESKTAPLVCAYDGWAGPARSARRRPRPPWKTGVVRRGKIWSAAP